MKLRKLLVLLLLLGAAFVLSACGEQGAQGETGATGAQGETGAQGDKGAKGDTGDAGEKGEAGANGSGIQFSTNSEGITWRYVGETEWKQAVSYEEIFQLLVDNNVYMDYLVDSSVSGLEAGAMVNSHGNALVKGETAFATIEDALAAIKTTGKEAVVYVEAGTYEGVEGKIVIDVDGVTLVGANAGITLEHDSEFDAASDKNTVLTGKVVIQANDVSVEGLVCKKGLQIAAGVSNPIVKEVVFTECNDNGVLEVLAGEMINNVLIKKAYYTGKNGARPIYVYGKVNNLTVTECVALDDATGIYDFCRVAMGTEADARVTGEFVFTYNWAKGAQSGLMDRVPKASKFIINNNYFMNIPAAVYLRGNAELPDSYVEACGNTFEGCGNYSSDWDALTVSVNAATVVKINNNNFIDCLDGSGTGDYNIKVRTSGSALDFGGAEQTGSIDCSNNFFNTDAQKTINCNAVGLTYAEAYIEMAEMPAPSVVGERLEAKLAVLAADFLADFNAKTGKSFTSVESIDSNYVDGSQTEPFLKDADMITKWSWLIDALMEAAESQATMADADFVNSKWLCWTNVNAFFTCTQHKDTWTETQSVDYTDASAVMAILAQKPAA